MHVIKGFASHAGLYINQPGLNNAIGEISTISLTYAKEKGFYTNTNIDREIGLISFLSEDDSVPVEINGLTKDAIIEVLKAIFAITLTKPGVELDHDAFAHTIITDFSGKVEQFKIGKIVSDGMYCVPEWVSWRVSNSNPIIDVHIWLADESFRNQYPQSEIVVVPVFDRIDDFIDQSGQTIENRIAVLRVADLTERLQNKTEQHPPTFNRYEMHDYHDPINKTRKVPVPWGVLVYGIMGYNTDSIKDAIVDWILANSNYDRDRWAVVFPDLFKRNEIIMAPAWDRYALPNKSVERGIHSPVMTCEDIVTLLKTAAPDYEEAHIRLHGTMTGYPYRSLAMTAIGHMENKEAMYRINQIFPDWINTPINQDFNRMEQRTKDWSRMILDMVKEAETFDQYSAIPTGMMRIKRGDLIYLAKEFEGLNYLVFVKSNMEPQTP